MSASQPSRNRLIAACLAVILPGFGAAASAQTAPRRPQVIVGPSAVYNRGYSANLPQAAGFSYQAGYAAPAVVPLYANQGLQPGFVSGRRFSAAPLLPYGTTLYGSTYPGYGFGFGSGFGALGYSFNYPGATLGYGYLGANYPAAAFGFVSPTWYGQQMQGYYRQ